MAPSEDTLSVLTREELHKLTRNLIHIPSRSRSRKADLISFVLQHGSDELLTSLEHAATTKAPRKAPTPNSTTSKPQREDDEPPQRNTTRRVHEPWHQLHDLNQFLRLPNKQELHSRYQRFYEATSNEAVAMVVCGICGREVGVREHEVVPWHLNEFTVEQRQCLVPYKPHPDQYLVNNMLLEEEGLYPKSGGFDNVGSLQRAMRGTVTTYEHDMSGIASMVEGGLMPRPPAVLASVITVAFIGRGKLSKKWLRDTFKEKGNEYYRNIEIDPTRLAQLPEDDIPYEIESVIRRCDDEGVVLEESAGYVPTEDFEEDDYKSKSPDVIPMQYTGGVDVDLTKLTASELMHWGLANLWKEGEEGGYAVRRGSNPVCDFPSTAADSEEPSNYYEKVFPLLFPYGEGGFEKHRPVPLSLKEHVQWALQYHDRRFRTHGTFPFVTFGILQKRQALESARIQMHSSTVDRDAAILSTITSKKLKKAAEEESKGEPISDPAVRLLRNLVHATSSRVDGSDQSRTQLRSKIWSTAVILGPPFLWLTINPSDIHDPIAQVFAGEKIDLDNFLACNGPSKEKRSQNIADDPYAAAKFYHFIINTIMECLFGVKVTAFQVTTTMGVMGEIAAYFGMDETQGRGMIHLHILLFLKHTPSADQILEFLRSEEFRARIVDYIRANFRAYLPSLDSAESVSAFPKDHEVAFNRPPKPQSLDYEQQLRDLEFRVARAEQLHTCKKRVCLIEGKDGRWKCKRRAPFECAEDDYVDENGHWCPKRKYEYMNAWVPALAVNMRCNNDGKFLTNGRDASNITRYVTSYATKKQKKNHNVSAVMAKGFAYHLNHPRPEYADQVKDTQRLFLFRLVNSLNREQELAAPIVMAYLMGWGDHHCSHTYSPIYWGVFNRTLLRAFPELRRGYQAQDHNHATHNE
ncbi:hypothetical protein K435DRAFT_700671 [Dendrothele bispora CBS 962.96]|uniref:Uncharacterized protein n=1 Tax=Dendrothele bispora (strain CBS 962.96) TaxID=1314807 RepID=A0A4S8KR70_DENBC|nr:hypothetical protein K435DRAFT_700671 [Dendrothele bispora CBS 962.96]